MMQKGHLCVILLLFYYAKAENEVEVTQLSSSEEPTDTSTVSTTTLPPVIEVYLNDDKNYTWASANFPKPYPVRNQALIIKVPTGYSVLVTVEFLNLESKYGDFLIIKPGATLEGEGKGKVFIYNLKSSRAYLVHSNTVFIGLQVFSRDEGSENKNDEPEDVEKGFSLLYQRIGEKVTTTTENPTTAVTWPTPGESDSIYYIGYVSGQTQEDFMDNKTLLNFKTALAEMASEYCKTKKILLSEEITEKNVHINHLIQCNYTWPNSETCMKARFAIPVLLQDHSTWGGYQLTTEHLEEMWVNLARSYLQKYNMDVYSVPNNHSAFRKWVVISCIVLLLFLILLYCIKLISRHFSPSNTGKKRLSDTSGFIAGETRTSNTSLAPHPYQTTPALFDNDYSFEQYEVDIGLPKKTPYTDYSYPLSEDDSDNDIIFSNFSNSRNNMENTNNESRS